MPPRVDMLAPADSPAMTGIAVLLVGVLIAVVVLAGVVIVRSLVTGEPPRF